MEEAAQKERLEDGLPSREADADITAVSFLSCSLTEVSGSMPGPDVGGRSQGVRVGDVLLPERERCPDSHWAGCLLWDRVGGGPSWPPALALLACSTQAPPPSLSSA